MEKRSYQTLLRGRERLLQEAGRNLGCNSNGFWLADNKYQ